ncbi:hypothetical protein niasHS_014108 [Heterodera schachtii]|uniref:Cortactin-binding protein-2 N-terminal domain-containing protein n=1 Tax=Heterodera schachtii TaxID=97005 RepID=A0ABD2IQT3_HETSC
MKNTAHSVEKLQSPPLYSSKEMLELLCLYEGELQARDALLDFCQQQHGGTSQLFSSSSHCSSVATALLPSTSSSSSSFAAAAGPNALLRDTHFVDSGRTGECAQCANALLHAAKIMQRQRNWELKIVKVFALLKKRYLEGKEELEGRQRRMELMAEENGQYVKQLETERDELVKELAKCKTELAELFEQRVNVEEQLETERERTRLMVTHLVDEVKRHRRRERDDDDGEGKRKNKTKSLSKIGGDESADSVQMRLLRDENARLLSALGSVKADKAMLKKRLDQIQQNDALAEQHQQIKVLKQSKLSPTRTEKSQQRHVVTLHDNNNGFTGCTAHNQQHKSPQNNQQQKQPPLFPPLPPQPLALSSSPSSCSSPASSSSAALSSSPAIPPSSSSLSQVLSSSSSFSTIPPRPPAIRASASFPLHLGSSPSSPPVSLSFHHHHHSSSPPSASGAVVVVGGGVDNKKRPTTAPEGSTSNRRTVVANSGGRATMLGAKGISSSNSQQHMNMSQFPVTDSDWLRMPRSPPVAADHHRVVVPLMGTHSANFARSSAVRHHAPLPPVPRTSVATIPRSPQHRRTTTMGATGGQQPHIVGAVQAQQQHHQQPHQQTRVGITRRSSSLPRRMVSGVPGTASAPPMPQQFLPPNLAHHPQQHMQHPPLLQQHNHQQQHRTAIPTAVSGEQQQLIYQPNNNTPTAGGDKYSHFL